MKKERKANGFDAQTDNLIRRIEEKKSKVGEGLVTRLTLEEENRILPLALMLDDGGYYMPNLQGCLPFPIGEFYELMAVVKPKNAEEFMAVVSLSMAKFKSRKKVVSSLRENELEMTIFSVESFQRLLAAYEITESDAQIIISDVMGARGRLREWEELVLQSHEVPSCIINQFDNIVSLPSEELASLVGSVILQAVYLKFIKGCQMEESDPFRAKEGFVGPFFWIRGTIVSKRLPIDGFDVHQRFFDVRLSHMELFEVHGLDGDYGNYPRGRVLYDNFRGRFVIYADADLLKRGIKEKLRKHFGLEGQKMVFRKDDHYNHDGL